MIAHKECLFLKETDFFHFKILVNPSRYSATNHLAFQHIIFLFYNIKLRIISDSVLLTTELSAQLSAIQTKGQQVIPNQVPE